LRDALEVAAEDLADRDVAVAALEQELRDFTDALRRRELDLAVVTVACRPEVATAGEIGLHLVRIGHAEVGADADVVDAHDVDRVLDAAHDVLRRDVVVAEEDADAADAEHA